MTAQTILPANTLSSGFDVANSCRFDEGSSDNLSADSFGTPTSDKIYTLSWWFKRTKFGEAVYQFGWYDGSRTNSGDIVFDAGDTLSFYHGSDDGNGKLLMPNRLFRDPSAWTHVVWAVDTTQGTASNRIKIYFNGVRETSFSTEVYPDQNAVSKIFHDSNNRIAAQWNAAGTTFYNGYMAEIVFIDGQQLTPTSFGEFDEDSPNIWKPIDVSDLTFGNNGFYLDFEDSSALGDDVSGNNNDFTVNNLTAVDQSTDTCTNNFATWNPLTNSNGAITEGNLKYTTSNSSSNYGYRLSTIGVNKGKWYAEIKYTSSSVQALVGIRSREATAVAHYLGYYADDYGFYIDGSIFQNNVDRTDIGASWGNDDIVGIYLDLDNNKLYFSKNGTLYTATGYDITAAASTTTGNYFFSASEWNSDANGAFELNVGNPSFALANTAITDDNGYGAFEYSPNITGDSEAKKFYALNTKNLAEFG